MNYKAETARSRSKKQGTAVKVTVRRTPGAWEDGVAREEAGGGAEGAKAGSGSATTSSFWGSGRGEFVEGMVWVEVTAGEGRRGAISGEIWSSKGKIVGEDGIVFVVGKEKESEEKDTKVMSFKIKDEAMSFITVMMNKSMLAFFWFVLSFSLLIKVHLCCNDTASL